MDTSHLTQSPQLRAAILRDQRNAAERDEFKENWLERMDGIVHPRYMRRLAEQAWRREWRQRWETHMMAQGIPIPPGFHPPALDGYYERRVRAQEAAEQDRNIRRHVPTPFRESG